MAVLLVPVGSLLNQLAIGNVVNDPRKNPSSVQEEEKRKKKETGRRRENVRKVIEKRKKP